MITMTQYCGSSVRSTSRHTRLLHRSPGGTREIRTGRTTRRGGKVPELVDRLPRSVERMMMETTHLLPLLTPTPPLPPLTLIPAPTLLLLLPLPFLIQVTPTLPFRVTTMMIMNDERRRGRKQNRRRKGFHDPRAGNYVKRKRRGVINMPNRFGSYVGVGSTII